jgi:hypothetical protein
MKASHPSMKFRLAVLFGFGCLLLAEDTSSRKLQVTHTENAQLPAGGLLRFVHSTGELTIEAWDQPGVQITIVKSTQEPIAPAEKAKAMHELDEVRVAAVRKGSELVVTTVYPHHWSRAVSHCDVEYRVKVPRSANLAIDHGIGEVHLDNLTSNIQARVRSGSITALLPQIPYSIDAKAVIGDVTSDFQGKFKRSRLFGRSFVQAAGNHKLNFRVHFGDIMILKAEKTLATY